MLSKQLKVDQGTLVFPMIENATYVNADNIDTITFTAGTLYVIEDPITPSTAVEYTIPENCILHFNHGAYFGSNVTLRLTRTVIEAHLEKIFDGTKIYGLMQNERIPVEWFGAVGDGVTDDAAAINACIKYSGDQAVVLGGPHYRVKSTIRWEEENMEQEAWRITKSNPAYTYSTNYYKQWPNNKRFLCYGMIIGDATLGDSAIISISIVSTEIYINCVKMLSTSEHAVAVWVTQPQYKMHIHRIIRRDDGQGTSYEVTSDEEPSATPTGYGLLANMFTCYSIITIGTIAGFKYGFAVDDSLSSYGYGDRARMGINKFRINQISGCINPVYVNLTGSGFFNGNSIEVQEVSNGTTTRSLLTGNMFTILNSGGADAITDTYIHCDYAEGWFNRFFELARLKDAKITGMYSMSDIFANGVKTPGAAYTKAKNKTAPYTEYSLIKLDNCTHITFDISNRILPYDMITATNCTNIIVTNTAPAWSTSNYGTLADNTLMFEKAFITRKNGENTIASTDQGDTITLLVPSVKLSNKLVYTSAMPASPDTSKVYCIPVSDMGLGKFSVNAYLNSGWKVIGYTVDAAFSGVYTLN